MHDQVNWTSQDSGSLIHLVDPNGKGRGDELPGLPDAGGILDNLTGREKAKPGTPFGRQRPQRDADLAIQNVVSKLVQKFNDASSASPDDTLGQALVEVCGALSLECCALVRRGQKNEWSTGFSWNAVKSAGEREFAPIQEFQGALDGIEDGDVLSVDDAAALRRPTGKPGQTRSVIFVPFGVGAPIAGVLVFGTVTHRMEWQGVESKLRNFADFIANLLARRQAEDHVRALQAQVDRLSRAGHGGMQVRGNVRIDQQYANIIGKSAAIGRVIDQAEQVAGTESIVLLTGETGTGKELVAQLIHDLSSRRGRPMVKVNCAALPPNLVESELFGRERGAYTGALSREIGRFELAHQSTIFLDELAELPLELQAKLLRVLQGGEFERVGSPKPIRVNTRVIAATNRDLKRSMSEGKFREDLYYRLNVFPIDIPPLRERAEDIPMLAWAFVGEFGNAMGKTIEAIPQASMEALQRYPWPGNVRELRNVIERAMIVSNGPTLRVVVPSSAGAAQEKGTLLNLRDLERQHILDVMRQTRWRVRGAGGAAELLGLKPTTLEARMAKLGISRNGAVSAEGAKSKSPLANGAES